MFLRAAAFRADAFAARFLGGEVGGVTPPTPPAAPSSGGSPGYYRPIGDDYRTPADIIRRRRREERERLDLTEAQQRKIDRAAAKIAATAPPEVKGGLLAAPAVMAAPAFDRLLTALRPTEGQVMALVQAIMDRLAWMQAEQDEEEAVIRLLMEMD